jgi:hypothetical protein
LLSRRYPLGQGGLRRGLNPSSYSSLDRAERKKCYNLEMMRKIVSSEEKTNRLNCYSDFYTAALAYYRNPSGTTHLTFIKHGEKMLEALNEQKLIDKCDLVKEKLSKSNNYDKYIAEEILMIGTLVRN